MNVKGKIKDLNKLSEKDIETLIINSKKTC